MLVCVCVCVCIYIYIYILWNIPPTPTIESHAYLRLYLTMQKKSKFLRTVFTYETILNTHRYSHLLFSNVNSFDFNRVIVVLLESSYIHPYDDSCEPLFISTGSRVMTNVFSTIK